MLFANYNIDKIPVIKWLCKDIVKGFLANRDNFNMTHECNLLTDHIRDVISSKSKHEKDMVMKSMDNIYENAYYHRLMEQLGDYYDVSDPLFVICDNICRYHYKELVKYGWEDNVFGIWTRAKMLEDTRDARNLNIIKNDSLIVLNTTIEYTYLY
jgi:hypothetical protein